MAAAFDTPAGLARLERLCEAYLSYIERRVFPGGCFFAGMLAEFDARFGSSVRDDVADDQRSWIGLVEMFAEQAQARSELDPNTDLAQLMFEVTAAVQLANYYFVLFGDETMIERAHVAIPAAITRASRA